MNIFSRSTRQIVAKGRPKEGDNGDPGVVQEDNHETITSAEADPAVQTNSTGNWVSMILNSQFWQNKAYIPIVYGLITGVAIIAATLLYIWLVTPAPTVPLPEVADNQAVIAVSAEAAIISNTKQGDIVRLYSSKGAPVTELQYVQVYQSGTDTGLLLIVDDVQAEALVKLVGVPKVALVVSGDADRAAELVAYQSRINHPTITLTLQSAIITDINERAKLQCSASIEPAELPVPEIVWTSDNPGVVTVKDGALHPITAGEATITATCGKVTASCKVTIVVDLKSILLGTDKVTLAVKETAQLAATAEPLDATTFDVTWSVADPAIATVDENGTVTAVAPGKTVVTAACGEITASCEITVGYHAEVVQLDKQELKLIVSHKEKLKPTVYPGEHVIDEGRWEVDNHLVANVDKDGNVTAITPGETKITYICGDARVSCTIKVYMYEIPEGEGT